MGHFGYVMPKMFVYKLSDGNDDDFQLDDYEYQEQAGQSLGPFTARKKLYEAAMEAKTTCP